VGAAAAGYYLMRSPKQLILRASSSQAREVLTSIPRYFRGLSNAKERFRFGIITDVQYANIDDGASYHGIPRFYRNSLLSLTEAVDDWVALEARDPSKRMSFAIHLGDVVDGKCPQEQSEQALKSVLAQFKRLACRTYHIIGNHCLYNFPRSYLNSVLEIHGPNGGSYYSFSPSPGWRVVVLDTFDVSLLGWPQGHPHTQIATNILGLMNPNENKNMPDGLEGPARRFVGFGGGVGAPQLAWLKRTLARAGRQGEKVLVMSHCPVMPGTAAPVCLMWNYEEVLEVLRAAPRGCVVATFSGHTHEDGYLRDDWGIHHRCLVAPLETPPGTAAHGQVVVYGDRLEIEGVGALGSALYPFSS